MSGERLRVTYPDLAQPSLGSPNEIDDPPPEYSTLPPPSLAGTSDLRDVVHPRTPHTAHALYPPYRAYMPLRPVTPITPVRPIAQTTSGTQDVRSTFTPVPHVFKPSYFMPSISNETAFHFTITGLDERTTNFINSLVELGLAAITIFGTLFTYWWGNRKAKCEMQRQKKIFDEWKAQGDIGENEEFVFTRVSGDGEKEKDGKKGKANKRDSSGSPRSHSREWNLANP